MTPEAKAKALFREVVLEDCRCRYEALFGCLCDDAWLDGWRAGISFLREQDRRVRELRAQRSVARARAFLLELGAGPGMTPAVPLTAHAFFLRCEVQEALAESRTKLKRVGEVPRDLPKLTSSGVDAVILFFESHADVEGRSRWLTDQELAVMSFLLDPDRIHPSEGEVESSTSPAVVLERETKTVKRARELIGELRTEDPKREAIEAAKAKVKACRKPVPQWAADALRGVRRDA